MLWKSIISGGIFFGGEYIVGETLLWVEKSCGGIWEHVAGGNNLLYRI